MQIFCFRLDDQYQFYFTVRYLTELSFPFLNSQLGDFILFCILGFFHLLLFRVIHIHSQSEKLNCCNTEPRLQGAFNFVPF